MERHFKNIAFISYCHKDIAVAKRIHRRLLGYRVPNRIKKEYPDLPPRIRKVFRDQDELTPGHTTLSDQIKQQLSDSKYLVVICTPNSKASTWVNLEIDYYIKILHRGDYVIPYIPLSNAIEQAGVESVFPDALSRQINLDDTLCVDEKENGKKHAFVKLVAGLLDVQFSELWDVSERIARRKRWLFSALVTCFAVLCLFIVNYIVGMRRQSETNQRAQYASQSLEALRSGNLITAERLALKSADGDIDISEAETALRAVYDSLTADFGKRYKLINVKSYKEKPQAVVLSPEALHYLAVAHGTRIDFIDTDTFLSSHELDLPFEPEKMELVFNGRGICFYRNDAICIYDTQSRIIVFGPFYAPENERLIGVNDSFAVIQDSDNVIRFHGYQGKEVLDSIDCDFPVKSAILSSRHGHIAFLGSDWKTTEFRIYDIKNRSILLENTDSIKYIHRLSYSPLHDYFYVIQGSGYDVYRYYRGKYVHQGKRKFNQGGGYTYYSDAFPVSERHDFWGFEDSSLYHDNPYGKKEPIAVHDNDIIDFSLSDTGNILATTGEDNQLKIWRKAPDYSSLSRGFCTKVAIQRDGGNNSIFLVRPFTGTDLFFICNSRTGDIQSFHEEMSYLTPVLANDGRHVLTSDSAEGVVRLWDYETNDSRSVACDIPSNQIVPNPDGTGFLCTCGDSAYVYRWENGMRKASVSFIIPLEDHVFGGAFSDDGEEVGVFGNDTVRIFDSSGSEVFSFNFKEAFKRSARYSYYDKRCYEPRLFFSSEYIYLLLNGAIGKINRVNRRTTILHGEFERFEYDFGCQLGVTCIGNRIFQLDSQLTPRLIGLCQGGTYSRSDKICGLTVLDKNTVLSATDLVQWWDTRHSIPNICDNSHFKVYDCYVEFDEEFQSHESWGLPDNSEVITQYEMSPNRGKALIASTGGLYFIQEGDGNLASQHEDNALYGTFYNNDSVFFAKYQDSHIYFLNNHDDVSVICNTGLQPNCLRYLQFKDLLLVGTNVGLLLYSGDGELVRRIDTPSSVEHIAKSDDETHVSVCLSTGDILVFNNKWNVIARYSGIAGESNETAFIGDERLAIKQNKQTLVVYNIEEGRVVYSRPFVFDDTPSLSYLEEKEIITTSQASLSYPSVSHLIKYLRQDCSAREQKNNIYH